MTVTVLEEEEEEMKGKRKMRIEKSFERVTVEIVIGSIALMRIYPSARMRQWAMSSLHVFVPVPLFFSLINPLTLALFSPPFPWDVISWPSQAKLINIPPLHRTRFPKRWGCRFHFYICHCGTAWLVGGEALGGGLGWSGSSFLSTFPFPFHTVLSTLFFFSLLLSKETD